MTGSKTYVIGNWKMNMGPSSAKEMIGALSGAIAGLNSTNVWLAVPSISLSAASEACTGTELKVGAQNSHWEASGAFTGELSIPMLQEVGASFTLSGHSERRHLFGESNDLVAKRTLGALQTGFTVIHCIGETLAEREAGQTVEVLQQQLQPVMAQIAEVNPANLLIAYEPVWAIGTGKVAGSDEIRDAHEAIAAYWSSQCSLECPPILYGGSVSPDNFAEIRALPKVAGGLIGGASLVAEKFTKLIEIAEGELD